MVRVRPLPKFIRMMALNATPMGDYSLESCPCFLLCSLTPNKKSNSAITQSFFCFYDTHLQLLTPFSKLLSSIVWTLAWLEAPPLWKTGKKKWYPSIQVSIWLRVLFFKKTLISHLTDETHAGMQMNIPAIVFLQPYIFFIEEKRKIM